MDDFLPGQPKGSFVYMMCSIPVGLAGSLIASFWIDPSYSVSNCFPVAEAGFRVGSFGVMWANVLLCIEVDAGRGISNGVGVHWFVSRECLCRSRGCSQSRPLRQQIYTQRVVIASHHSFFSPSSDSYPRFTTSPRNLSLPGNVIGEAQKETGAAEQVGESGVGKWSSGNRKVMEEEEVRRRMKIEGGGM